MESDSSTAYLYASPDDIFCERFLPQITQIVSSGGSVYPPEVLSSSPPPTPPLDDGRGVKLVVFLPLVRLNLHSSRQALSPFGGSWRGLPTKK